ncbi:glucose-6-phosphate isomerase [Rathayibacter rathayi]|uniref:glucose-6-phosphate isomerase n=1 Tax=Rathayibacter rathayi TaxID=33887 RepID=UPI000CE77910|nr:glucose-6-phosphate isomerase [Rathayibacter rathayi]PPG68976.1 glucose-6-phosphate isomerase [Rathayibacter rathayi]PPG78587.1 glucose-6-phosphate isomerase [Rathayibacter rathayi]PPH23252.1 glucose-6-phosphate isomerase [Rathayibacter rathayi]PPI77153.1 glucose-6-phosphate isomerase [Rathayibacter rathayi]
MALQIHVSGDAGKAVDRVVPELVADEVASGITAQVPTLWGAAAEEESAKRLGWTESTTVSRPLVPAILALREEFQTNGIDHIVLGGMGGSSLAPEVITRTAGVELTVLDSTAPGQVLAALTDRLASTAVVISSKSGSTVETASQKKAYEKAFTQAGIDPLERIVIVTDPGSPLDSASREAGYRVFNADPNIGGRFSALSAFGLVPSGLAGADIEALLDEAAEASLGLAVDSPENPGLILGAAIAATSPRRDKLAIVADGTEIVGFADWAEQLIAESTGKDGTGILPVVLGTLAPELSEDLPDVQVVRLVEDATALHLFPRDRHEGEILLSGSLGAQMLTWEYAVAVAGRLLGINPFDQPDVESAKVATRALLDKRPAPEAPAFTDAGIEVTGSSSVTEGVTTVAAAVDRLLAQLGDGGYVSIQAYVDRLALPQLEGARDLLAAQAQRPVTFGWGPRFLHSTGQYHKGGAPTGVFLQITERSTVDLEIPESPFTFGQLILAQAAGDASVLAEHGRPVLTLTLTDPEADLEALFEALNT